LGYIASTGKLLGDTGRRRSQEVSNGHPTRKTGLAAFTGSQQPERQGHDDALEDTRTEA
jgi:hypothetical protein